ncbi:chitobiase [Bacteroidia bacterium]|nr:chitobiase [Bacteroidia bacterium]
MKTIKKSSLLFIVLTALCVSSCENMMDVHQQFIEDGERIRAPKVHDMQFFAGENQILFRFMLKTSPNVTTVDVFWNDRADSLIIPVTPTTGLDTFKVILPNMAEKSYTFEVRTTDSYGHHSLVTTGVGTAYGTMYRKSLSNRRVGIGTMVEVGTNIQVRIPWGAASTNLVQNEIRYTAVGGAKQVIEVTRTDALTSISDAEAGSLFESRSWFLPDSVAIDTFKLAWDTLTIDPNIFFDRTSWEVLSVSDEQVSDGGGKVSLIDGNLGTYWHSQTAAPAAVPPHWAIIDMKASKNITRIEIYRRTNNSDAKTVQYFVSDDPEPDPVLNTTWVQIGSDVVFPNTASPQMLPTDIPSPNPANIRRYLKIYLPDSNRSPFTSIAEVYVFGRY